MASCYAKDSHDDAVIRYSTKVIERVAFIEDENFITNAYLSRGLAYERSEMYRDAIHDLMRVREM